ATQQGGSQKACTRTGVTVWQQGWTLLAIEAASLDTPKLLLQLQCSVGPDGWNVIRPSLADSCFHPTRSPALHLQCPPYHCSVHPCFRQAVDSHSSGGTTSSSTLLSDLHPPLEHTSLDGGRDSVPILH